MAIIVVRPDDVPDRGSQRKIAFRCHVPFVPGEVEWHQARRSQGRDVASSRPCSNNAPDFARDERIMPNPEDGQTEGRLLAISLLHKAEFLAVRSGNPLALFPEIRLWTGVQKGPR